MIYEPRGSMWHSGGLSNNSYPELLVLALISLRSILILCSNLCLGLPRSLFPVGLYVIILSKNNSFNKRFKIHNNLLSIILDEFNNGYSF